MQRAATGLAYAVLDLLGAAYGRRVLVLVGPGDNGGDALHAGALLARRGCAVDAWLLADRVHEAGLAALRAAGGRVVSAVDPGRAPDVVVDGIVGIGGHPGLRPNAVAALDAVRGVPLVAVDTPSGVDVDTGQLDGAHVRADVTVTFGTYKVTHLVDPAAQACGAVHLVDLGLDLPAAAVEALQPADVAALLPRPGAQAQKYTRGVVGVRAGSAEYPGAGLLSVAGAATGLCGMVRYVGDGAVADRVRQAHPEVVGRRPGAGLGGGLGRRRGAPARSSPPPARDGVPLVVDADALAHVDGPLGVPAVLTPHAGELAAMLGVRPRRASRPRPLAARARGRRTVRRRGAAQGPPHAGRPARRTGAGDHHRRALAGHRRRRRRARRPGRRAARRRPRRRTTPRRSAPGCTAPPRPSPRAAARSSPGEVAGAVPEVVRGLLAAGD